MINIGFTGPPSWICKTLYLCENCLCISTELRESHELTFRKFLVVSDTKCHYIKHWPKDPSSRSFGKRVNLNLVFISTTHLRDLVTVLLEESLTFSFDDVVLVIYCEIDGSFGLTEQNKEQFKCYLMSSNYHNSVIYLASKVKFVHMTHKINCTKEHEFIDGCTSFTCFGKNESLNVIFCSQNNCNYVKNNLTSESQRHVQDDQYSIINRFLFD